jgi:hypothetical protein
MSNPQRIKGDRAEREIAQLIEELTGIKARRTRPGRLEDQGDLHLELHSETHKLAPTIIQVAAWRDTSSALRIKPLECEQQRQQARATHAATAIKLPRAGWRIVLTIEQYMAYLQATIEERNNNK